MYLTNDHQFGAQPKIPVLLISSIVANATAALRLYQLELSHIYRYFFGYLVFNTARSLFLFLFSGGRLIAAP
jgi:hypothetical protein